MGKVGKAPASFLANEGIKICGIKIRSLSIFKIAKETNYGIRIIQLLEIWEKGLVQMNFNLHLSYERIDR